MIITRKPRLIPWKGYELTVGEYIKDWLPDTDLQPIHQRLPRQLKDNSTGAVPSKSQSIIHCVLQGGDINEIKNNIRTEQEMDFYKYDHRMESIDGGHRSRALLNFYRGHFPTHSSYMGGVYFKQFTAVQKSAFLDFPLRLVVYDNLLPEEKADIWFTGNIGSPLNRAEKRNGVGNTPGSDLVRCISRSTGTHSNKEPHLLFENSHKYLKFTHEGMTIDTAIARPAYALLYGKGGPFPCDDEELDQLYRDVSIPENKINSVDKKLRQLFDFIHKFCKGKIEKDESMLTLNQFVNLWRCYLSWCKAHGDYEKTWRVRDSRWVDLYMAFAKADTAMSKHDETDEKSFVNMWVNPKQTCWQKYNKNSQKFKTDETWIENVTWLSKVGFDFEKLVEAGILVKLDSRRVVGQDVKYALTVKNDWKEPITGKRLTVKNSHAGHMKAHAEGGCSTPSNTVVLTQETNLKQGKKDWDTFSKELEQETNR